MADVKAVLEQLIQKTKAGTVPWKEAGDGRGELEAYKATCGDVEFHLTLEQSQLRINGALIVHKNSVPLGGLHEAIIGWLSENRKKRDEQEIQRALDMAAKVLGS